MPIAEPRPRATPKKERGNYCERAYGAIMKAFRTHVVDLREKPPGTMHAIQKGFMQASNWIKRMGPAGEELAVQMRRVADSTDRTSGDWSVALDRIKYWKTSLADREAATFALWKGEGVEALNKAARRAYDELEPTFASALEMAQLLDGQRQMPDGTYMPIKGSGRPYPTITNKRAQEAFAAAAQNRKTPDSLDAAIKITMLNEPEIKKGMKMFTEEQVDQIVKVAMGHVDEATMDAGVISAGKMIRERVDYGFQTMARLHDDSLRGVFQYFERTRIELPKELLELDPLKSMPGFYDNSALFLSAAREWGWDQAGLTAMLARITKENSEAHSESIKNFIASQLGRPSGETPLAVKKLAGAVSDYQMIRLFGATVVGPLRNAFQPMTNAVDLPVSAIFKSLKDLPPFVHGFAEASRDLHEMVLRSGAITSEQPTTEGLSGVPRKAAVIHTTVITENEYRAAVIGYYGTMENVRRVMEMQGDKGPIASFLSGLRHLSLDPEGSTTRALEHAGVDPERIEGIKETARQATPDELKALLDKPADQLSPEEFLTAMRETSKGTQFGYDFANKILGRDANVGWRLLTTVKGWGFRMGGFISQRVMKEFVQHGNAKPLVKLLGATFLLGEMYSLGRDWITGNENSLYKRAMAGALTDEDGTMDKSALGWTILRDIGDGGGIALFMDVLYGANSMFGGPVGSSLADVRRAWQNIGQEPRNADRALMDFIDKEFVATNQWKGAARRFQSEVMESPEAQRFFDYNTWRDRSYKYLDAEGDPNLLEEAGATAQRFLASPRNDPTERSLTYEDAADAIKVGDVDRAAGYFTRMLRYAEDRTERESMLSGMETAGNQRSPIGPVPRGDRNAFLSSFPPSENRAARSLQNAWERDWSRAINKAKRDSR